MWVVVCSGRTAVSRYILYCMCAAGHALSFVSRLCLPGESREVAQSKAKPAFSAAL